MDKKQSSWRKYGSAVPLLVIVTSGAALRLLGLNRAPPGLHFDEAVYGLMALDIYRGRLPVFFSAYTGREPLYMYIMAAVFRLVGIGALGIRLTSALIGIATVLLAFLLFRELFHRRIAWIAAALTALNYWHLTVSRNGYPNILIPPMECLALYGLWRGYRDGHRGWMALGGIFVGGVLYTYLAARLFPVTVAAFFLYALLVDRHRFRARISGILLAALVAVLVFAPLGAYFVAHPHDFWERANQVLAFRLASGLELPRVIAGNIVKTLGGFFLQGDPRQHYNLPGKPIFDPILGAFFVAGIVVALRNWRRPEYGLLPVWVMGMCLPAVLTREPMPQGQRIFGVIPAIFALAALGIDAASEALRSRLPARLRWLPTVALVGLLTFEGWSTAHTYFTIWVRQPATYYIFNTDYVALASEARKELDAGHKVVIQSYHYKHPTVIFAEPSTLQAVWTVGGKTLVVPGGTSEVTYLWPVVDNPADEWIASLLEQVAEPAGRLPDPWGETMVAHYRLRSAAQPGVAPSEPLGSFANEVEVLAVECPASVRRDEPLRVLVRWRVASPVSDPRTLVLHLVDENDVLWAQGGEAGHLQEQWRAGDTVYQVFETALPPGIPAGRYQARLILYREGGAPLPVIRQDKQAGLYLNLGDVTLTQEGGVIQPVAPRGTLFGDELQAIEYGAPPATTVPGGNIKIRVTWQARQRMAQDHSVSINLYNAQGSLQQHHEQALAYQYPTSSWQAGEVVQAAYVLPVGSVPAGAYQIRLQVSGLPGELAVGETRVQGQERVFAVPAIEHPLSARFGQQIELLGYDLARREYRTGEAIRLQLYWQAQAAIPGDYKVFVHLLGEQGQVLAQDDSVPDQWQRPTTGWEPLEVIADEHILSLPASVPPGQWSLWIGMYNPATMQRLPVQDESGLSHPDDRLPLGSVTVVP